MRVSVKVKGTISESHCHSNLTSLPILHAAQKEIEKVIKDYMEQGWEAAKRMKVDLPHFADKIHRKYPKDWQKLKDRWEEEEMQSPTCTRGGCNDQSNRNVTNVFQRDGSS